MKKKVFNLRKKLLLIIILFGIFLTVLLFKNKIQTKYEFTFTVFFQLFGNYFKTFDRLMTKVIPVDSVDEKALGEFIAFNYEKETNKNDPDYIYLNSLIKNLTKDSKKPFKYKVFIFNNYSPNAFALPGGVILVSSGLMPCLNNEGELVSILAHEIGHIELEHCFDLVKFELLERKMQSESIGKLVDLTVNLMLTPGFSKTIENEADVYAFDFIIKKTVYDPYSLSDAFKAIIKYINANYLELDDKKEADILNDYYITHPLIDLRIENFENEAKLWWKFNQNTLRYKGEENLIYKINYYEYDYGSKEWIKR